MKKILYSSLSPRYLNLGILILRIVAAVFMLTHGWPKLNRLIEGGDIKFADPIGMGPILSLVLVVFAEFVCSILIGIGLWTRLASIPLMITMAVAAFIQHGDDPFARKELALLYLAVYIFLLISGSGKYSFDYIFYRKSK